MSPTERSRVHASVGTLLTWTLKWIHTWHLCYCSSVLQWTGLVCWCLRCWRFWRSAACNWRSVSTACPPERATEVITPSLKRKHVCWCYSAGKLQLIWSLHPEISSTFTHLGERMHLHDTLFPLRFVVLFLDDWHSVFRITHVQFQTRGLFSLQCTETHFIF